MSPRGRRCVVNRTGPNTEPCGTPHFNFVILDYTFLIATYWVRLLIGLKPAQGCPFYAKIPPAIGHGQQCRKPHLNLIELIEFFSSKALMMSLCTRTRAVSTLCPSLYADWNISARLHIFRWSKYCSHASDSSNLDKKAMLQMDLRFLKLSGSRPSFFSIGFKTAVFRSQGETPIEKDWFTNSVKQGAKMSIEFFKSHVGIRSSGQCLIGRDCTAFTTVFAVTCLNTDRENRGDESTMGWSTFVRSGVLTRWSHVRSIFSMK